MRFAHLSDCHLGSWRQPELLELNFKSFRYAINKCIEDAVGFVLFSGDLFDSAFPSIDILKETFAEFRRLKEAKIKCYIIAGSHDYSVSGKTFLDVLEKSGFCEICKYEEKEGRIILKPIIHESFYIYGYPGKKSGMEIADLKRINIEEPYENRFRILMLHTTLKEAIGNIPTESIESSLLPKADYYALGHIHTNFEKEINGKPAVYSGPLFPNNFKEFEDLKSGSFYIIEVEGYTKVMKKEVKLKETEYFDINIEDSLTGTSKIISELQKRDLKDKIVLLKIHGNLKNGKPSDIKFQEIDQFLEKQQVYSFLKNTSRLDLEKKEYQVTVQPSDMEKVEEILVKEYEKGNPSGFNKIIFQLMDVLGLEKQEEEKNIVFESRLILGLGKIFDIEL
jgi:DNA repair protein SbcD/Mre11